MSRLKEKSTKTILFAMPAFEHMAKQIEQTINVTSGEFILDRFLNMELHITLHTPVKNCDCIVLGTIAPPEINVFTFLLLCHTLKKENAKKIIAVLPYLAYSRHDKNEPKKSYATALIGQLLVSAGVTHIVTVDIHSTHSKRLFPMPLISLSPAKLFSNEIAKLSIHEITIVAPDEGAINRCKAIAKHAGIKNEIAYLEKKRTEQGIFHSKLHGKVTKRAIIVDDILDTGGTIISCCERLFEAGVKKIDIMITHGLFTGDKWEQLWRIGINRIYCTDTVSLPLNVINPKITMLSVVPLLIDALKKI